MQIQKFLIRFGIIVGISLLSVNPAFASSQVYSIQGTLSDDNLSDSVHGLVYEMDAGTQLEGAAVVVNLSNESISLDLFAVDAQIDSAGNFALKNIENEQVAMGAWITLPAEDIVLAPNTSKKIPFTLTLPDNVTPGQYAGGLVVTPSRSSDEAFSGSGLSLTSQVGLRVYLSVTGEAVSSLAWNDYSFERDSNGMGVLSYNLFNEGNTLLDVTADIDIEGLFGETKTVSLELGTVAPGHSIEPEAEIELPFMDVLTLRSKISYEVSAAFSFNNDEKIGPETMEKELKIYEIPWLYIGLMLLVLTLLVGAWIILKKHSLNAKDMKPYKVKPGDTILDLAEKHECDWSQLAKVNNLKAPYALNSGMTLLVPNKTKQKDE